MPVDVVIVTVTLLNVIVHELVPQCVCPPSIERGFSSRACCMLITLAFDFLSVLLGPCRKQKYFYHGRLDWDEKSSAGRYVRDNVKPLRVRLCLLVYFMCVCVFVCELFFVLFLFFKHISLRFFFFFFLPI